MGLTMRLRNAGLRRHPTKLIYPNHRLPPWLTGVLPSRESEHPDAIRNNKIPQKALTNGNTLQSDRVIFLGRHRSARKTTSGHYLGSPWSSAGGWMRVCARAVL